MTGFRQAAMEKTSGVQARDGSTTGSKAQEHTEERPGLGYGVLGSVSIEMTVEVMHVDNKEWTKLRK